MRYVIKLEPIASADRGALTREVGPQIQRYFTGDPPWAAISAGTARSSSGVMPRGAYRTICLPIASSSMGSSLRQPEAGRQPALSWSHGR